MDCANHSSHNYFILLGFSDLNTYLQSSIFIFLLLVYISTLTGNLTIILLITVDNILQTPMYSFLRNLSFLEACFISTTVPKTLTGLCLSSSRISFVACAVQMFLFVSMGATECLFLLIMAYDRHVAICNPLRYSVIISPNVCVILMSLSWLLGALVSIGLTSFIFSLPYCGSNVINHFFCDMPAVLILASADTFMSGVTVFVAALICCICPFIMIVSSYVKILSTILRMSSKAGRLRVFSTCGSHLFSVILFYGSTISMYLRISPSDNQEQDKILSILYSVVTPMLNPLIYTLRNKDVKGGLKRLLRRSCLTTK